MGVGVDIPFFPRHKVVSVKGLVLGLVVLRLTFVLLESLSSINPPTFNGAFISSSWLGEMGERCDGLLRNVRCVGWSIESLRMEVGGLALDTRLASLRLTVSGYMYPRFEGR